MLIIKFLNIRAAKFVIPLRPSDLEAERNGGPKARPCSGHGDCECGICECYEYGEKLGMTDYNRNIYYI